MKERRKVRRVDFNTTECSFQFACRSLHDNMTWMAGTSTGGEKGTIKQEKGKETEERKEESATGDKPQTGAITLFFAHFICIPRAWTIKLLHCHCRS